MEKKKKSVLNCSSDGNRGHGTNYKAKRKTFSMSTHWYDRSHVFFSSTEWQDNRNCSTRKKKGDREKKSENKDSDRVAFEVLTTGHLR